jgi:hypothetical protein
LSIIQRPFSDAPCQTLISRFATFSSLYVTRAGWLTSACVAAAAMSAAAGRLPPASWPSRQCAARDMGSARAWIRQRPPRHIHARSNGGIHLSCAGGHRMHQACVYDTWMHQACVYDTWMHQACVYDTWMHQACVYDTWMHQACVYDTWMHQACVYDTWMHQACVYDTAMAVAAYLPTPHRAPGPRRPPHPRRRCCHPRFRRRCRAGRAPGRAARRRSGAQEPS